MFDNQLSGVQHSIPIATNFKAGPFSFSANANYDETWVFQTTKQTAQEQDNGTFAIVTDTIQGFDSYRTYRYGANVGTTVYGMWQSKDKSSKVQAVRHVVRPSVSYNANPSFEQYYDRILDEQGVDVLPEERFASRFERTLFGAPGRNFSAV
jgi:hypothetical protein